jgi:hypothetical protein
MTADGTWRAVWRATAGSGRLSPTRRNTVKCLVLTRDGFRVKVGLAHRYEVYWPAVIGGLALGLVSKGKERRIDWAGRKN